MPRLDDITPVILTYNEAPNLERTLSALAWAKQILIVDSDSSDATREIAQRRRGVTFVSRAFTTHAEQWNFAIHHHAITTPWVLALDADYFVTEQAAQEIASSPDDSGVVGYRFGFNYAVLGKVIRSGIYPPVVCLFRRDKGRYLQDGHTQRLELQGETRSARARLIHDDRKPFARWASSQARYAQLEAEKLSAASHGLKGWIRTRTPVAAVATCFYCLVVRGGLLEGPPGWLYALQRTAAEGLIAAAYFEQKLRSRGA